MPTPTGAAADLFDQLDGTHSVNVTTRLLDMASWLLIRRALKEGDISESEAQKKRKGVALQNPSRSSHVGGFGELPEGLRGLVEESYALQDRIVQLGAGPERACAAACA